MIHVPIHVYVLTYNGIRRNEKYLLHCMYNDADSQTAEGTTCL